MLKSELQRSSIYTGSEALEELTRCASRFWDEDSTGEMLLLKRGLNPPRLESVSLAGCAQESVYNDILANKCEAIDELLIIDSGNSSGDSWKAIFHIQERVLVFIYEA